jgi:hypothetical protein
MVSEEHKLSLLEMGRRNFEPRIGFVAHFPEARGRPGPGDKQSRKRVGSCASCWRKDRNVPVVR